MGEAGCISKLWFWFWLSSGLWLAGFVILGSISSRCFHVWLSPQVVWGRRQR